MVYFSQSGHATGTARGEHALEVMLPFLQVALGDFKLVAIVMGDQEEDTVNVLGEVLAAALKDTNTLMVASTDLSHFHSEKAARRLDGEVQKAIEQYKPGLLLEVLGSGRGEACGGGPVTSVLAACQRLGGEGVQTLGYTTSGETTGFFDEVVGYYSAVITTTTPAKVSPGVVGERPARPAEPEGLAEEDKQQLRQIARDAIRARLDRKKYTLPKSVTLSREKGAFVTLKIDGELRGCIGQIRANQAINKTIAEMAVAAAFEDPRFSPLTEDEYDRLEYEISILSPLKRLIDPDEIKVGRDGLMIRLDYHSGLLLPQVADEHNWSVKEFLEQTCLKAGLPKNSYQDKHAEIYRFSADIF
jgi:AmmeMemoRadiSam system protein A